MKTNHLTRKEALAHLAKNALGCVTWTEGGVEMSAIYWNGKRHIQPSNATRNWSRA